jgi:hypothetical protein
MPHTCGIDDATSRSPSYRAFFYRGTAGAKLGFREGYHRSGITPTSLYLRKDTLARYEEECCLCDHYTWIV